MVILACSAFKDSYRQLLWRDPQRMRLVYLKWLEKLIQQRLQSRYNHFMSADLLDTQLDILEEPKTALYVDISDSSLEIVAQIKTYLQLLP